MSLFHLISFSTFDTPIPKDMMLEGNYSHIQRALSRRRPLLKQKLVQERSLFTIIKLISSDLFSMLSYSISHGFFFIAYSQ